MSDHEPTKYDGSPRTGSISVAEIMARAEFTKFALDPHSSRDQAFRRVRLAAVQLWAFYVSARKAVHSGVLGALVAAVAMQVRVALAQSGGAMPSVSTLAIAVLVGAASGLSAYYSHNAPVAAAPESEPSP